ncbi:MAG: caspase family protein [Bacteroidia bacterium]|nr:caspase family protein [Bacteroidia bacterium]
MHTVYHRLCLSGVWLLLTCTASAQTPDRVLNELGQTLSAGSRRLLEIIEESTQVLYYDPQNAASYNNRATAYFEKGEYQQALDDYTAALARYPRADRDRMARVHYKRGLCYYILGQYAEALDDFGQAIVFRPDISDSYYFRGKIRHIMWNQRSLAREDLEAVLRLNTTPSIQTVFARYLLGDIAAAADELRTLEKQVQADQPAAYAQFYYNLAGLQGLIGNGYTCAAHLRKALEAGYRDYAWLVRDPNFQPVALDRDFLALLDSYRLTYRLSQRTLTLEPLPAPLSTRQTYRQPPVDPANRPAAPLSLVASELGFADTDGNNRLDAGETAHITLSVSNAGPGAASRVWVRLRETTGLSGLVYDTTFTLGALTAGTSRTLSLPVSGHQRLATGEAVFEIQILESYGFDALPAYIQIPTQAFMPPRLEIPDHHFASETGGYMRTGVPLILKLGVQNTGTGPALDVVVRISVPENVFMAGPDTFHLGTLAPGASQVAEVEFFTNRRYAATDVPLTVTVTEATGKFTARQTCTVTLNQPLEVSSRVVIKATPSAVTDYRSLQLLSDVDRDLPRALQPHPDAVAVIIGNRDYQHPDVPAVAYALHDAASMRKYLVTSFGFQEDRILFLPNATQADLNGVFGTAEDYRARLFNLVDSGVTDIFVFYSGHGAPDIQTGEAYIVPVDCDPTLVRFNGYSIQTLYNNLSQIPYRTATVVLDACFSGMSDQGTLVAQASPVRIKTSGRLLRDPRAAVLTAAGGSEIASWYPDQTHGLFTYYLLKGLQGAADTDRDRDVSVDELRTWLQTQVPAAARRIHNRTQTPEVYGDPVRAVVARP